MISNPQEKFNEMNELSQKKVPFLFIVDFVIEKIEILTEIEILKKCLLFDFQNNTTLEASQEKSESINFKSYPETIEEYSKILFGKDFIFKNYTLKEVEEMFAGQIISE